MFVAALTYVAVRLGVWCRKGSAPVAAVEVHGRSHLRFGPVGCVLPEGFSPSCRRRASWPGHLRSVQAGAGVGVGGQPQLPPSRLEAGGAWVRSGRVRVSGGGAQRPAWNVMGGSGPFGRGGCGCRGGGSAPVAAVEVHGRGHLRSVRSGAGVGGSAPVAAVERHGRVTSVRSGRVRVSGWGLSPSCRRRGSWPDPLRWVRAGWGGGGGGQPQLPPVGVNAGEPRWGPGGRASRGVGAALVSSCEVAR